jgi:hypothetical protein
MSFTTGDADIKLKNVKITSEKNVTVDDVVKEAVIINKKMIARKIKPGDFDLADQFMSEMRKEHKEFSQAYPIVLRYMCQMQQFNAKALRKYLLHIQEHPYKSEHEYLDSQTDYVVYLYKAQNKRWNTTQISNLRKNVRKMLGDEHSQFVEISKKHKEDVEREELLYKAAREDTMKAFYSMYGNEALEVPIRAATELPLDSIPTIDVEPEGVIGSVSANDLLA